MATLMFIWAAGQKRIHIRRKFYVVVLSLWIICCATPCSPFSEFVTVPDDQSVREGDSITFLCILKTNHSIVLASAFWEKGLFTQVTPSASIFMSTDVNHTSGIVTSSLRFENIQREMDNSYSCSILLDFADRTPDRKTAELWSLTVFYFLRASDYLQCRGPENLTLHDGTAFSLECVAAACKPTINLTVTWMNYSAADTKETLTERKMSVTWLLKVDKELHGKLVSCVATSTEFPKQRANCSVGPFSVLHQPINVQVIPNQATLFPPAVKEIQLSCQATGYPMVHFYNWILQPSDVASISRAWGQNATVTLLGTHMVNVTFLNITCGATNQVGISYGNAIIDVSHIFNDTIPMCANLRNLTTVISLGDVGPELLYKSSQLMGNFLCSTHMMSLSDVTFRWYVNGRILTEEMGTQNVKELSNGSRISIVQSWQEINSSGIIACKILSSLSSEVSACSLASPGIAHNSQRPTKSILEITTVIDKSNIDNVSADKNGFWGVFWIGLIAGSVWFFFGILIALFLVISRGCKQQRRLDQKSAQRESRASQFNVLPRIPFSEEEPVYDLPDEETGLPTDLSTMRYLPDSHMGERLEANFRHPSQRFIKESSPSSSEDMSSAHGDAQECDGASSSSDWDYNAVATRTTYSENQRVVESGGEDAECNRSKSGGFIPLEVFDSSVHIFSNENGSSSQNDDHIRHIYFPNGSVL